MSHKDDWRFKHGMSGTPEHQAWQDMFQRCYNPNCQRYSRYGARGIRVCERWTGPAGFVNFLADMGRRPSAEHSIERANNDGHYEPSNCRWATRPEQNRNRNVSRLIEYRGRRQTVAEWAREIGVNKQTLLARLWAGMDDQEAIETPVAHRTWTKTPGRPGRRKLQSARKDVTP